MLATPPQSLLVEQGSAMMAAAADLTTTAPAARVQARQVQRQPTMLLQPGLQVGFQGSAGGRPWPACLPAFHGLHLVVCMAASPGVSSDQMAMTTSHRCPLCVCLVLTAFRQSVLCLQAQVRRQMATATAHRRPLQPLQLAAAAALQALPVRGFHPSQMSNFSVLQQG